jgi:hypothetical protein
MHPHPHLQPQPQCTCEGTVLAPLCHIPGRAAQWWPENSRPHGATALWHDLNPAPHLPYPQLHVLDCPVASIEFMPA